MLNNCFGILSATESRDNLRRLAAHRAVASIPIAGKYRVIDFGLSNMVNSGIKLVGILTQTDSRSLRDHIGSGGAWDLNRRNKGLYMFHDKRNQSVSYDLQILNDNKEFLSRVKEEYVVFASTYLIANVDIEDVVRQHQRTGAVVTLVYKHTNEADKKYSDCGVLQINPNGEILSVEKNKGNIKDANISMEIFVMKKSYLESLIDKVAYADYARSLKSVIYENLGKIDIKGYEHKGYLGCVNSLLTYYNTNMDMLDVDTTKELFFKEGRAIYSKSKDSVPTKYSKGSKVSNSLVANGCEIAGTIKDSIISRSAVIEEGAEVENCIILQNCKIKTGCKIKNVIMDKNVVLEEGTELRGSNIYPLIIEKEMAK